MLAIVGDEWTLLVMQQALMGATRYGQFTTRLPISNSVLTRRLGSLTEDGLLHRHRYQERPPRDEYLITPRGRALWPVLVSIWEWERHWVPEHREPLPRMRHLGCGADFTPVLTCGACGEPTVAGDVTARWGPSGGWSRSLPVVTTRRRSADDRRDSPSGLFPQTMSVLGNRWAFAILVAVFTGTSRFSEFQRALAASPASLADRLQTFRDNGILTTTDEDRQYRLTPKGAAFLPVLVTALAWAQRSFPAAEGPAVLLKHTGHGHAFSPVLRCDQCGDRLTGAAVSAVELP
ncbi:winged helix-turn-helix transcriptional regulator [Mycolicibacterium sp. 050232]|uniref:winged helix-turn-helix transcriptional regulator n=1 Tax=Mycolicibacterium sp. 050232 TaxID=3113982 RepID=UPI002E2DD9A3|nr:winged helix-turn-helix transcriptional regulator [Mycolicibacterium sp. 050232]MED5813602.1 winged helix-turn-helix transcriptional regulator [Mycolicibacterium sp. 050232]